VPNVVDTRRSCIERRRLVSDVDVVDVVHTRRVAIDRWDISVHARQAASMAIDADAVGYTAHHRAHTRCGIVCARVRGDERERDASERVAEQSGSMVQHGHTCARERGAEESVQCECDTHAQTQRACGAARSARVGRATCATHGTSTPDDGHGDASRGARSVRSWAPGDEWCGGE